MMGEGESNLAFLRSWGCQTVCRNKLIWIVLPKRNLLNIAGVLNVLLYKVKLPGIGPTSLAYLQIGKDGL